MKKTYRKYVYLVGALVLGFVGMQTAFADVNVSTPGPNLSVGNNNNGFLDNNFNWGDNKNWRCVARGRDGHRYRDYGSDRSKARDHALNYCEKHTRNCEIDSCNRS
jgi:hypothetical protein